MKKAMRFYAMILSLTLITAMTAAGCGSKVDVTSASSAAADSQAGSVSGSAGETQNAADPEDASNTDSRADGGSASDAGAEESGKEDSAVNQTTAESTGLVTPLSSLDLTDMFSKRDQDASYDESSAAKITLNQTSAEVSGTGVSAEGSTVTITEEGTYVVSGTLTDGQIIVEADDSAKVQIVLNGVTMTNDASACILVRSADKVFVTLADGTVNTLSDTGAEYVQESEDYTIDGVIFSREDLTFNGSGTLVIEANYKHGIVGKDDVVITGGTYTITAKNKGIAGKDSVRIQDGTIQITSGDDAIHTSNSEKEGKGFVYIEGGTLTLSAGDDGIHAETALVIAGGTIDITESYEGLEGASIDILDGTIQIKAGDDGMNAAISDGDSDKTNGAEQDGFMFRDQTGGGMMDAQPDAYLRISGGTILVDADGDGLDSNGMLYVDGGTITVEGPTNDGNGALDYGTGAGITGGTVIATGSSGMAETFGESSTQYSILYNFESAVSAGTEVTLTDASGNVILSAAPQKNWESIVVSSADLTDGTYTIKAGDNEASIEVSSVVTTAGASGGMMGMMEHGGNRGNDQMQRPDDGTMPDGALPDGGSDRMQPPGDGNSRMQRPGGGRGGFRGGDPGADGAQDVTQNVAREEIQTEPSEMS